MRQDDFVEIMREIVPKLIDQAVPDTRQSESERPESGNAEVVTDDTTGEPPASRPRVEEHLPAQSRSTNEVLSIQVSTIGSGMGLLARQ